MKKLYLFSAIALLGFFASQVQAAAPAKVYYTEQATLYFFGTACYTYWLPTVTAGGATIYRKVIKTAKITTRDIINSIGQAQEESFSSNAKLVEIDGDIYVVDGTTNTYVNSGFIFGPPIASAEQSTQVVTENSDSFKGDTLVFCRLQIDSSGYSIPEGVVATAQEVSGPGTIQTIDIYGILREGAAWKDNPLINYGYYSAQGSVQGTFTSSGVPGGGVVAGIVLRVPALVKNNPS